MLSIMDDDILCEFHWEDTIKMLCDAFQARFGVYTSDELCQLNITFNSYNIKSSLALHEAVFEPYGKYDRKTQGGWLATHK